MSHVKSSLHWSVIHYQVTFEEHSGGGLENVYCVNSHFKCATI